MKKTYLLFLTLFFLSMTITLYAQQSSPTMSKAKAATKIEKADNSSMSAGNDKKTPDNTVIIGKVFVPMYSGNTPAKNTKLKVTLVELQSATTQNGKLAHLGIRQHIMYKSKGKVIKPIFTDLSKVGSNRPDCGLGKFIPLFQEKERDDKQYEGSTALICGDRNDQIHVTPKTQPLTRSPNINHSAVFELTSEQVNDTNAKFILDTFVVEYSTTLKGMKDTSIVLIHDPRETEVAIHDVLAILQGNKNLNEDTSYIKDGGVPAKFKFDHFDGVSLPLRNVNKNGKMILEGPIRARNKGKELIEKAFVWMRFELID